MKYIPKKIDSIDAMKWDHNNVTQAREFLDFLAEHNLGVTFCAGMMGGVAAEIHQDGVYQFDVEPDEYLVVEADGTPTHFDEHAFGERYKVL